MAESSTVVKRSQLPFLGAYVEPRSSAEKKIAEIWSRTLDMDFVGVTDNYEDLGGDSLQAASIFAELETCFAIKIPWALLAEAGTIEQWAAVIDNLQQRSK